MLEAALNTKLIKFCTCVGLLERHTCYSTRRSAIIETSHTHGSEQAKDGALHKPTGNSLFPTTMLALETWISLRSDLVEKQA